MAENCMSVDQEQVGDCSQQVALCAVGDSMWHSCIEKQLITASL